MSLIISFVAYSLAHLHQKSTTPTRNSTNTNSFSVNILSEVDNWSCCVLAVWLSPTADVEPETTEGTTVVPVGAILFLTHVSAERPSAKSSSLYPGKHRTHSEIFVGQEPLIYGLALFKMEQSRQPMLTDEGRAADQSSSIELTMIANARKMVFIF